MCYYAKESTRLIDLAGPEGDTPAINQILLAPGSTGSTAWSPHTVLMTAAQYR